MKNRLLKILLISVLAVATCLGLVACGASNWKESDVTLKNPGAVVSVGGFVAETDNYVYFINGVADSSSDNNFGMPVKGSLMAADKSDLSKHCVVVPKLFVAQDYKAGVYIFNEGASDLGYVYYATPSTDLNSSGSVANTELVFMRTKLDGTGSEKFFSVSGIATEYRIVKGSDNHVYIVYYDSSNTKLVSYDTFTKTALDVCTTNVKANELSLAEYKFFDNKGVNDCVVAYTVTVYTEPYDEASANAGSNYSRASASYNKVFAYKVGDNAIASNNECVGKCVLDSDLTNNYTYAFSQVYDNYIFYTQKDNNDVNSTEKTYAKSASELYDLSIPTLINNVDNLASCLFIGLDEIYVVDNSKILKTVLKNKTNVSGSYLANASSAVKLLFVKGDYIYFVDSSNQLSRVKINNVDLSSDADKSVQRVSEGGINGEWFNPQIVGDTIYYIDSTTFGNSYVYTVSASTTASYDKDNEIYYLEGQTCISKISEEDMASKVDAKISAVSEKLTDGKIVLVKNETSGELEFKPVEEARQFYNDYLANAKNTSLVKAESITTLKNYEEAIRLSKVMYGLYDFDKKTDAEKDDLSPVYNNIRAELENLNKSSAFNYDTIEGLIENNLFWFYQTANTYFTKNA